MHTTCFCGFGVSWCPPPEGCRPQLGEILDPYHTPDTIPPDTLAPRQPTHQIPYPWYSTPPERTWDQRYPPSRRNMGPEIPSSPWTDWQTPVKTLAYPQLLLRAVIIYISRLNVHISDIRDMEHPFTTSIFLCVFSLVTSGTQSIKISEEEEYDDDDVFFRGRMGQETNGDFPGTNTDN